MCQAIGLRADLTTMAQLREAWAAKGLRWPDESDQIDDTHPINLDDYKETEMTARKNTTAKTNTTAKETTMTENKPSFADRTAARIAARIELQQTIQAEVSEPTIGEVTSCLPGKGPKNLCDDPVELELLRYAAAYYGWTTNEFCTESQAKKFGGTLIEGAEGFDLIWLPKTTKTGKNAGVTTQWVSKVYPATAFVWANGTPDDHDYTVAQAEKRLRRAQRELDRAKKANQPKAKTKAEIAAENDELRASLAQMQAMMAQLMAANGLAVAQSA